MDRPEIDIKDITKLSPRMFWDTPIENIDPWAHRGWIIERVMRYGTLSDWRLLRKWYNKETMRKTVVRLRDLDMISIAYLSLVLEVPKENFKCYTERQLRPSFWHR